MEAMNLLGMERTHEPVEASGIEKYLAPSKGRRRAVFIHRAREPNQLLHPSRAGGMMALIRDAVALHQKTGHEASTGPLQKSASCCLTRRTKST